jgi:hypothetical protein
MKNLFIKVNEFGSTGFAGSVTILHPSSANNYKRLDLTKDQLIGIGRDFWSMKKYKPGEVVIVKPNNLLDNNSNSEFVVAKDVGEHLVGYEERFGSSHKWVVHKSDVIQSIKSGKKST